jgi:hypothetical protein
VAARAADHSVRGVWGHESMRLRFAARAGMLTADPASALSCRDRNSIGSFPRRALQLPCGQQADAAAPSFTQRGEQCSADQYELWLYRAVSAQPWITALWLTALPRRACSQHFARRASRQSRGGFMSIALRNCWRAAAPIPQCRGGGCEAFMRRRECGGDDAGAGDSELRAGANRTGLISKTW